ncbi:MAG: arylesterase [Alphaproteobacteria bacterium]|nr:MAG: arylesterase [Alphaproteobacteria bacterium]
MTIFPRTLSFYRRPACAGVFLILAATALSVAGAPVRAAQDSGTPLTLLAFGDSLIHGYGLRAGETFPERLEAALRAKGYNVRVVNGGNSGDTTAAGLARLDWMLAEKPDMVLLELGANDALRGLDPDRTYANLDAILRRLKVAGIPVLLAGMKAPRNLGADYARRFDAIFTRLARVHDVPLYPFFLDGVALDPALNQDDGLHPNAAGVEVIVARILPNVIALITQHTRAAAAGG